jgi:hypothetical protein
MVYSTSIDEETNYEPRMAIMLEYSLLTLVVIRGLCINAVTIGPMKQLEKEDGFNIKQNAWFP